MKYLNNHEDVFLCIAVSHNWQQPVMANQPAGYTVDSFSVFTVNSFTETSLSLI